MKQQEKLVLVLTDESADGLQYVSTMHSMTAATDDSMAGLA
ncbi:hypothetical protein [Sodalis sp.]